MWTDHLWLSGCLFVVAQIVCGLLGYRQGAKDAELTFLRAKERQRTWSISTKTVGKDEDPDTLRSGR